MRIRYINHGTGNIPRYRGVKTNEGSYGIIFGSNPNKNIYSFRGELMEASYKYNIGVPKEMDFIIVKKLPNGISSTFAYLYYFDNQNNEINPSLN